MHQPIQQNKDNAVDSC